AKHAFAGMATTTLLVALSACGGTAPAAPASASLAAVASQPASAAASPPAASGGASAKPAASGAASAKPAASASANPIGNAPLAGGSAGPAAAGQFTDGNPYLAKPGEAPVTVKGGWCAISAGFTQLYVARDYGFFAKYGINIQTGGMNSGADAALAALNRGDFDFMYCAAAATIPGLAAGVPDTLVAAPLVGLPYQMVGGKNIHSVQDLKGKKLGINAPGDLDEQLSRAVLKQEHIPANQVTFVPAGGQTQRYTNLLAGVIDSVNVTPPLEVQAQHDGLNIIYQLKTLPIPFIYSAMHTNDNMLKQHPQTVQRFLAAIAESTWWMQSHKQETEQSISKQLDITDSAALDSAYSAYSKDYANPSIDVPMKAVQDSIDYAKTQGTPIQKSQADQIVDQRFVQDLQASGFLEKMWGKKIPPSNP
ncbi:MAG TPA: ABC transporter substrate-binding protein, partial [Chloroflexota bacterium]|nr:ABC transporter substrate-binding protein [Chloroflexota bacterium]